MTLAAAEYNVCEGNGAASEIIPEHAYIYTRRSHNEVDDGVCLDSNVYIWWHVFISNNATYSWDASLISLWEFNLVHLESSRRRQNIIQTPCTHSARGCTAAACESKIHFRKLGKAKLFCHPCMRLFLSLPVLAAGLIFCSFSFSLRLPRDTLWDVILLLARGANLEYLINTRRSLAEKKRKLGAGETRCFCGSFSGTNINANGVGKICTVFLGCTDLFITW